MGSRLRRYAITFTLDETWNTTDTLIVETTNNPLDWDRKKLAKVLEAYGVDVQKAKWVAEDSDTWFIRNLEDVDVYDLRERD